MELTRFLERHTTIGGVCCRGQELSRILSLPIGERPEAACEGTLKRGCLPVKETHRLAAMGRACPFHKRRSCAPSPRRVGCASCCNTKRRSGRDISALRDFPDPPWAFGSASRRARPLPGSSTAPRLSLLGPARASAWGAPFRAES